MTYALLSCAQSPNPETTQLAFKAAHGANPKNNIPDPDVGSLYQYSTFLYQPRNGWSVVSRAFTLTLLVLCGDYTVFLERVRGFE